VVHNEEGAPECTVDAPMVVVAASAAPADDTGAEGVVAGSTPDVPWVPEEAVLAWTSGNCCSPMVVAVVVHHLP